VFETEGILKELRKREAHQTKSQKNKLKSIAARQLANKKNRKKEGKFNAK
jgi:ribosomal protein S21